LHFLSAETARSESAEARMRATLRARVTIGMAVREELALSGIDPTQIHALRLAEAAAAELASLGESPEPGRDAAADFPADGAGNQSDCLAAARSDGLVDRFVRKIADLANRYQDGSEPDFANASLAELFAWHLARCAARAQPGSEQ